MTVGGEGKEKEEGGRRWLRQRFEYWKEKSILAILAGGREWQRGRGGSWGGKCAKHQCTKHTLGMT